MDTVLFCLQPMEESVKLMVEIGQLLHQVDRIWVVGVPGGQCCWAGRMMAA